MNHAPRNLSNPVQQRICGITTHGRIPFDVPFLTEIVPGLWQGGCKDGMILPNTIDHLVCLYPRGEYAVKHPLASSRTMRMLDFMTQDLSQVDEIAR